MMRSIGTAGIVWLLAGLAPAQTSRPDLDEAGRQQRRQAIEDLAEASKLLEAGRLDQAEQTLRALLQKIPDASAAWLLMALTLRQNGKPAEALTAALAAIEYDKTNVAATIIGAELSVEKHADQARKLAKAAVDLEPDELDVVSRAVAVMARLKAKDEALPLIEKALERRPKEQRLLRAKAELALESNDWKAAAEAYRALVSAAPKDPLPRVNLAMVLSALGENDEAISAFREVVALEPTNTHARERLIGLMKKLDRPAREIESEEIQLARWRDIARKHPRPTTAPPAGTPAPPVKR